MGLARCTLLYYFSIGQPHIMFNLLLAEVYFNSSFCAHKKVDVKILKFNVRFGLDLISFILIFNRQFSFVYILFSSFFSFSVGNFLSY